MITFVDVYKDREKSMRFLYEMLQERSADAAISHVAMPSWQKHRQFVCRKPYRIWCLVAVRGEWVGNIYATDRNELGIFIKAAHQGHGYGPAAVSEFVRLHKPLPPIPSSRSKHWLANINPGNEKSAEMFRSLGFKHIQNTYAL